MSGRRSRGIAFGVGWAAALCATGTAAPAADESIPDQAVAVPSDTASPAALVNRGIELRKNGDDRQALAAFEQAWALGGSPQALAQLALAEQALGRWRDAHEHLEGALAHGEDPWISAHQATLEGALKEIASRLGGLEVTCNVDGAEVLLDGRLLGHTPLGGAVRLVAGESVIRVSAEGYFDVARQVQVDAGGLARLDVTLTASAPAGPAAGAPPEPGNPGEGATLRAAPRAPDAGSESPTSPRDVLTYGSLGLAALGVTAGVTGYVIREVNVRLYNDDEHCNRVVGQSRSVECDDELAAWRFGEVMSIAGFSAAGVFGLTALYLWLDRPRADGEAQLACEIGLASIGCSGRF